MSIDQGENQDTIEKSPRTPAQIAEDKQFTDALISGIASDRMREVYALNGRSPADFILNMRKSLEGEVNSGAMTPTAFKKMNEILDSSAGKSDPIGAVFNGVIKNQDLLIAEQEKVDRERQAEFLRESRRGLSEPAAPSDVGVAGTEAFSKFANIFAGGNFNITALMDAMKELIQDFADGKIKIPGASSALASAPSDVTTPSSPAAQQKAKDYVQPVGDKKGEAVTFAVNDPAANGPSFNGLDKSNQLSGVGGFNTLANPDPNTVTVVDSKVDVNPVGLERTFDVSTPRNDSMALRA